MSEEQVNAAKAADAEAVNEAEKAIVEISEDELEGVAGGVFYLEEGAARR